MARERSRDVDDLAVAPVEDSPVAPPEKVSRPERWLSSIHGGDRRSRRPPAARGNGRSRESTIVRPASRDSRRPARREVGRKRGKAAGQRANGSGRRGNDTGSGASSFFPADRIVPMKEKAPVRDQETRRPLPAETSSGIPIASVLRRAGSGGFSFTRAAFPGDVPPPALDDAPVAGFGTARETTGDTGLCSIRGRRGLPSRSISRLRWATTPTAGARGEVGRVGVAIASLDGYGDLLDAMPLDRVRISMTINATARLAGPYARWSRERGRVPRDALSGTVQNDILKEYAARGTYIYPAKTVPSDHRSLRLLPEGSSELEHDQRLGVSHPRSGIDGGPGGRVHARNAIAYVRRRSTRGSKVDEFAPRLSFFQRALQFLRRGREVPCGAPALGRDRARPIRREGPALVHAPLPRADGRIDADGAAAARQRGAGDAAGALGGPRRHADHCTPTPMTRRSRCRRRRPRGSRCDPAGHRVRVGRRRTWRTRSADRSYVEAWTEQIRSRARAPPREG